ncbi:SIR2 family protein (plasmid) [Rhizobium sp. CB3171]|uniref:SIR2 family protein n=1 Tax=Rhizobium sp. CB3171 TaxID=3039157 RepID=UPI0024B11687|nr:SIR2 family protein [Rhizobium sp. CB3171]WFU04502.1 SIR2 family protein [Rhizobium sp. CB3171]
MAKINRNEIFDKNLNFLIGSGASYGLLPTLALKIKDSTSGEAHTIETLATKFESAPNIKALVFSWYAKNVISPAAAFSVYDPDGFTDPQGAVLDNYEKFLRTLLSFLAKKGEHNRANVFTTNYDGLIAHVSEVMQRNGQPDFILNDGGSGFIKRSLSARNFNRYIRDQGAFDRHSKSVPQINLLQLHGSVYWYKDSPDNIEISYDLQRSIERMAAVPNIGSSEFEALIDEPGKNDEDIIPDKFSVSKEAIEQFWAHYDRLPIVNPTKWKFYETVFEEHYYQILRLLSYELEKTNTIFITFGFSFADEHILNLVKRSLSNPTLKVFACCFDDAERNLFLKKFEGFANVELVSVDGKLDFEAFNDQVFSAENL